MNDLELRLARAEAAIARLTAELESARQQQNTMTAPFRVVNADGRVLLEVDTWFPNTRSETNRISIYNRQGQVTAQMGAQGEGGFLAIRDDAGKLVGYLTTEYAGAKLELHGSHNEGCVVMGVNDSDGGWMNVLHASGGYSLTLGSDPSGGFLDVHDGTGDHPVVTLCANDVGGNIEVVDKNGSPLFGTAKSDA